MIDLEQLERAANGQGATARVSRSWLRQALAELREARAADARRGRVFGLPDGETI